MTDSELEQIRTIASVGDVVDLDLSTGDGRRSSGVLDCEGMRVKVENGARSPVLRVTVYLDLMSGAIGLYHSTRYPADKCRDPFHPYVQDLTVRARSSTSEARQTDISADNENNLAERPAVWL